MKLNPIITILIEMPKTLAAILVWIALIYSIHSKKLHSELPEFLHGESWETGNIPIRDPKNAIFYFLIRAKNGNNTAPLLIWLNGGPGCSSMLGLFEEMGPYVIDRDTLQLRINPYAWNNIANMLYVDQPVGVGFSTASSNASPCSNLTCIANDFYTFLIKFLERYPEFIHREVYIAGESFAGHYIPEIGSHILKAKSDLINFKGIALGNFVANFPLEITRMPLYMYENDLLSFPEYILFKTFTLGCYVSQQIGVGKDYLVKFCGLGLDMGHSEDEYSERRCYNPYDIREKNRTYHDLEKAVQVFLQRPDVQKYLGLSNPKFRIMNIDIFMKLKPDNVVSYSRQIEELLNNEIEVLLFFGDKDLVCNWRSGEILADSLEWNGSQGYAKTPTKKLLGKENKVIGSYKKHKNLEFLVMFEAGHLVPLSQPEASLDMIKRFIHKL